jgi:hypothetical protein
VRAAAHPVIGVSQAALWWCGVAGRQKNIFFAEKDWKGQFWFTDR